jgi:hypothetical protein
VTVGGGVEAGTRSGGADGTGVAVGVVGVGGAVGVVGLGVVGLGVVGLGVVVGVFGGVGGEGGELFGGTVGFGCAGGPDGAGATTRRCPTGVAAGAFGFGAAARAAPAAGTPTRTRLWWARGAGAGAPGMTTTLPGACPSGGAGRARGGASCGLAHWCQRKAVAATVTTSERMAVARSIPLSVSLQRQRLH